MLCLPIVSYTGKILTKIIQNYEEKYGNDLLYDNVP
jgi:hypothetical protein